MNKVLHCPLGKQCIDDADIDVTEHSLMRDCEVIKDAINDKDILCGMLRKGTVICLITRTLCDACDKTDSQCAYQSLSQLTDVKFCKKHNIPCSEEYKNKVDCNVELLTKYD